MFITLQFGRPNDAGMVTGWVALGITIISTMVRRYSTGIPTSYHHDDLNETVSETVSF